MDAQLKELIDLQREQNQLLKKYLWRFRFSLITLLLLTTAICICLGFVIYTQQTNLSPKPAGAAGAFASQLISGGTGSRVPDLIPAGEVDGYVAPSKPSPSTAAPAGGFVPPVPTKRFADPVPTR